MRFILFLTVWNEQFCVRQKSNERKTFLTPLELDPITVVGLRHSFGRRSWRCENYRWLPTSPPLSISFYLVFSVSLCDFLSFQAFPISLCLFMFFFLFVFFKSLSPLLCFLFFYYSLLLSFSLSFLLIVICLSLLILLLSLSFIMTISLSLSFLSLCVSLCLHHCTLCLSGSLNIFLLLLQTNGVVFHTNMSDAVSKFSNF